MLTNAFRFQGLDEAFFDLVGLSWTDELRYPDGRNRILSLRACLTERPQAFQRLMKFDVTLDLDALIRLPGNVRFPLVEFFYLVRTKLKTQHFNLGLKQSIAQLTHRAIAPRGDFEGVFTNAIGAYTA